MDDPADTRARNRSNLGVDRELAMIRTNNHPDPSIGGTRGFPLWLRQLAINRLQMMDGSYMLAAETANCSVRSIRRWEERIRPYRMAEGEQRKSITGSDQLLLSICLFIYPEATADKLCAFLIANGGGVYSRGQISERCFEMEISRKRCIWCIFCIKSSKIAVVYFPPPTPWCFWCSVSSINWYWWDRFLSKIVCWGIW